jgi:hypothetical protein
MNAVTAKDSNYLTQVKDYLKFLYTVRNDFYAKGDMNSAMKVQRDINDIIDKNDL